jgi:hypothetical protein
MKSGMAESVAVNARATRRPVGGRRTSWLVVGAIPFFVAACGTTDPARSSSSGPAVVLLFNGTGASSGDVAALEHLLAENHFGYSTADSRRLNAMSDSELRSHRLLLIPGGNFVEMGNGLFPDTASRLREAVRSGVNYLGICGGAFLAGNSPYNGLNLSSGVQFPFYSAEARGIRKAAVAIAAPGMPMLEHYWEDGPQLTGWGEAIAKYPDGTPAVAQGDFGQGRVILSGIHPEAPETWRRGMVFATPASVDNAYAVTLIGAALNRTPLPHY